MTTQKQWRGILETILSTENKDFYQAELSDDQILQYVQVMLAGQKPTEQVPVIQRLLEQNPQQAQQLTELIALFQVAETAEIAEPESLPVFDLSFLPKTRQKTKVAVPARIQGIFNHLLPLVVEKAKSAILDPLAEPIQTRLSSGRLWVRDQQGVLWVDFTARLLGQSSLQPVLVTRNHPPKPDATPKDIIFQLSIGSEELGDLDLEIKAIRGEDAESCTLIVVARVPSRWPDLAGVEVVLLRSEPLYAGQTDEDGQVIFEKFPVKDLERIGFQINPSERGPQSP